MPLILVKINIISSDFQRVWQFGSFIKFAVAFMMNKLHICNKNHSKYMWIGLNFLTTKIVKKNLERSSGFNFSGKKIKKEKNWSAFKGFGSLEGKSKSYV